MAATFVAMASATSAAEPLIFTIQTNTSMLVASESNKKQERGEVLGLDDKNHVRKLNEPDVAAAGFQFWKCMNPPESWPQPSGGWKVGQLRSEDGKTCLAGTNMLTGILKAEPCKNTTSFASRHQWFTEKDNWIHFDGDCTNKSIGVYERGSTRSNDSTGENEEILYVLRTNSNLDKKVLERTIEINTKKKKN